MTFIVWMINIDSIDSQEQTFSTDLAIRLTWQDDSLVHAGPDSVTIALDEIWHPRVSLGGMRSATKIMFDEEANVRPDGTVIYRQRFLGPLSQPLNLSEFPFDTQVFTAHFWAMGYDANQVEFVPEELAFDDVTVFGSTISSDFSLTDWTIDSFLAEPRLMAPIEGLEFAGFALDIQATRLSGYFMRQVVVPLALIVFMSWVPFWINPTNAGTQFSIASTTILTLIAYRFVAAGFVPRLPYLTHLDTLIFNCTPLVFAVLLQVLITSALAQGGREKLAVKIDKWCRVVFPATFVLFLLLFWMG